MFDSQLTYLYLLVFAVKCAAFAAFAACFELQTTKLDKSLSGF